MNDNKIKLYENRIEEDKELLNDLKNDEEQDKNNASYFRRINHLQNEINFMNEELSILRNKINDKQKNKSFTFQESTSKRKELSFNTNKDVPSIKKTKEQIMETVPSKDIESTVGKSLMGIVASILIFVSLIFFSKLLYENLTDTIKTILLFVVSFGITGVGLFLMKKNEKNKVFLSITGSGIGAIYVSLFISNIFLKTINGFLFYLFLFIWVLFVFILSKNRSILFQIIGQIGITISLILGTAKCFEEIVLSNSLEYLIIITFFVVTSLAFYIFHLQKDNNKNIVNNIFNLINSFIVTVSIYFIEEITSFNILLCVLLISYLIATIVIQYLKTEIYDDNFFFGIYTIISFSFGIFVICEFNTYYIFSIFGILVSIVLLLANELKLKSKSAIIINAFSAIILYASLCDIVIFRDYLRFFILSFIFIFYGLIKNKKEFQIYGIGYFILSLSFSKDFVILYSLWALIELALFYGYMFIKEKYSQMIKLGLFIPFLMFIISIYTYLSIDIKSAITIIFLLVIGIINIVMMKTTVGCNWITKEKEDITEAVCKSINASIMVCCLGLFSVCEGITLFLLISVTLVFFIINSEEILKQNTIFSSIYIGIKFTVLLIVILSSLSCPSYLISIACLILAIANIIYGFNKNYKTLRIYGLILTLFNIVKLLLIDISFENTLGLPLSLFICGILCLLISYIYNKMEQNFKK